VNTQFKGNSSGMTSFADKTKGFNPVGLSFSSGRVMLGIYTEHSMQKTTQNKNTARNSAALPFSWQSTIA